MDKFRVTFYPDNKTVEVNKDATILSAAVSSGIYVNSTCGGNGVCGRCKVILKKGKVLTQPTGIISLEEKKKNIYLACLSVVQSDLEIDIPAESRLSLDGLTPEEIHARTKGIYSETEEVEPVKPLSCKDAFVHFPLASKVYLELPRPTLDDKVSDLERIYRELRRRKLSVAAETSLADIRQLSELLRAADWKVTVTIGKSEGASEILLIEPQDTSSRNFGFCFDIGTTTITGQLVDLNARKVIGTKSTYNRQISFGSDIITRIVYAKDEEGLERLHLAVVDCIDQIIKELIDEHGVDLNDVTSLVAAGNTTMVHLLLSIDPTHIRREPYVSTANFTPTIRASEIGIRINPRGILSCLPGVASYVGGDVTSGVLSCGLDQEEDLSILIDIGTNGEIVLGNREFLISSAASAGPAFEGSGVNSGMRAAKGAIQKVKIGPPPRLDVSCDTIAGAAARGICGSGYIDILSEMLGTGILDKNGKIRDIKHERIREGEYGREFVIVFKKAAGSGSDIVINEADIDNLKRAKAAIYSATASLLKHMGFSFKDVKKFFIAGGFGTCLDVDKAVEIGLLPDLERRRFIFVGNSSLAGARQSLLSYQALAKAKEIAGKITYFELSVEPGYMEEYMAALFFPHTDLRLFPGVKYKG
ncbi:MAG: ASKHA domain-containing protein [Candidatus Omnitrophota bacterium]